MKLNNEKISRYVQFILDKIDDNFTNEDLDSIFELSLSCDKTEDLSEIELFNNLEILYLTNAHISESLLLTLIRKGTIRDIVFDNCIISEPMLIGKLKLKSLSLVNCQIDDLLFINAIETLEELELVKVKVSLKQINNLKKLKNLQISYSIIDDLGEGFNLPEIEELALDNTNVVDFSFVNNLKKLKKVSVDSEQYYFNLKYLQGQKFEVFNEGIVSFEGGDYNA